ncbi:MAG: pyridoxal phosphate-dependent aminotransferase [Campylobacter sp.]|nr:pyridoxal phosphate-dependent aminotransferase [Campylobacter sp.]
MKFDFETILDKRGLSSTKWLWMKEKNSNVPEGIVPFSVADMEFKLAPALTSGLKDCIKRSFLGYTRADDEYYEAVISWFKRRHNLKIRKSTIITTPGVVFALQTAIRAFSNVGDSIIIMPPVYYPFFSVTQKTGRKVLENRLNFKDGMYSINFKDLEKKAKEAKILILCNPHNPVGRVWSKDELTKIGEICYKNQVLVISDEIHCDLVMSKHKFTPFMSLDKKFRSITCTAPSKSFNIAGLQASNIIIKDKNLRNLYKKELEKVGIRSLNTLAYEAVKISYNECEEWLDEALKVIETNRNLVQNFIKERISVIKVCDMEGTYLMWLDFRELGLSCKELEKFMVKDALIFSDEGYIFGKNGRGFERINIACPTKVIQDAFKRLEKALKIRKFI